MQLPSAVSGVHRGSFHESSLQQFARTTRHALPSSEVSLGLAFLTPSLMDDAQQVLEILRVHAQIPVLVGCTTTGLIAGDEELEQVEGVALGLYHLPGAELRPVRFTQAQVEEANGPGFWHLETGIGPDRTRGWLAVANPFHLDTESWLQGWNEAYAQIPVVGGLAGGDFTQRRTQVYLNGEVFEEGGVALSLGGDVRLAAVISQGCSPIGETWTITRAERNLIHHIGNRPAYEVLIETFNGLSAEEQKKSQGNLFVGLVVNEYSEDFRRGDFLIRNLLGADPRSGSLAVGAWPRTGQTVQFQRRDPEAATEDFISLLSAAKTELHGNQILGGCLCCCNGRGQGMFGHPHHDASLIQHELATPGLTGFFCNGELGPVGNRNFLHGFTASLGLFVYDPPKPN